MHPIDCPSSWKQNPPEVVPLPPADVPPPFPVDERPPELANPVSAPTRCDRGKGSSASRTGGTRRPAGGRETDEGKQADVDSLLGIDATRDSHWGPASTPRTGKHRL